MDMAKRAIQLKIVDTQRPGITGDSALVGKQAHRASRLSATEKIVESITTAIIEHRLMPGTKLPEQKIASMFSVSRTIVRQALNQLSVERLVTLESARGAFVSMPSAQEAQEVFQVRSMIESIVLD